MPLYTTDALILRTYKLGESDRIVVFLTRDRGKKRGVAKNARQSRRRFARTLAAVGHARRGARLRRLLRRADRRMGAGVRPERNAVPAGRVDGRRHGRRGSDRAAGEVLRVLAAAASGRVRGRRAVVRRSTGVSDGGTRMQSFCPRRSAD